MKNAPNNPDHQRLLGRTGRQIPLILLKAKAKKPLIRLKAKAKKPNAAKAKPKAATARKITANIKG